MSNVEKGTIFEKKVLNQFELLGFDSHNDILFKGRQIDIFLEYHTGPIKMQFIVECKDLRRPVNTDEYDKFYVKLEQAKKELGSGVKGIIVSNSGFVKNIKDKSKISDIILIDYNELESSIINFNKYTHNEIDTLKKDKDLKHFIMPKSTSDNWATEKDAFEIIDEWLRSPTLNQITMLGDYGVGKTTLLKKYCLEKLKEYRDETIYGGARGRVPLYIDLREYTYAASLRQIILDFLDNNSIVYSKYSAFEHMLNEGQILLILDGFDELASRCDYEITIKNFRELNRAAQKRSKIILSCRTHYFTTSDEVNRFHGDHTHELNLRKSYTDLYRDISVKPNFLICYLSEFTQKQVTDYLKKRCGNNWKSLHTFILNTYDLKELSKRPVLLDMIVESSSRIDNSTQKITPGILYHIYTSIWLNSNDWSMKLTTPIKTELLKQFASALWKNPDEQLHYKNIHNVILSSFDNIEQKDLDEVDREFRAASFLVRDSSGYYRFSHKSFFEFFFAQYLLTGAEKNSPAHWESRFTSEIYHFLRDLLPENKEAIKALSNWITNRDLHPTVRVNAIKCLSVIQNNLAQKTISSVASINEHWIVLRAAATALSAYKNVSSEKTLIELMRIAETIDHGQIVGNIISSLGIIGTPKANSIFLKTISKQNDIIKKYPVVRSIIYLKSYLYDAENAKICIAHAPLDAKNTGTNRAIVNLCVLYPSQTSFEFLKSFLLSTRKPFLAAFAYAHLSTSVKKKYAYILFNFYHAKQTQISISVIESLRGVNTLEIQSFLVNIMTSTSSMEILSKVISVIIDDYPKQLYANATIWIEKVNFEVKNLISGAYATTKTKESFNLLVKLLDTSERIATRVHSILTLKTYFRDKTAPILRKLLKHETEMRVFSEGLRIFVELEKSNAIEFMRINLISRKRIGFRLAVTEYLAADISKQNTPVLMHLLENDDSEWVRRQALKGLCQPGRKTNIKQIKKILKSEADSSVLDLANEIMW